MGIDMDMDMIINHLVKEFIRKLARMDQKLKLGLDSSVFKDRSAAKIFEDSKSVAPSGVYGTCAMCSIFEPDVAQVYLGKSSSNSLGKFQSGSSSAGVDGIVDSGASHHMSGDRDQFQSISEQGIVLRVADRTLPTKALFGKFKPNSAGLGAGLYHPDLKHLLVSVRGSIREEGKEFHFAASGQAMTDPETGEVWEVKEKDGIFKMDVSFSEVRDGEGLSIYESESGASANLTAGERLRKHQRFAHFYIPGLKVKCPECSVAKGAKEGHRSERPDHCKPRAFLDQVDFDFVGPWQLSHLDNVQCLNCVETYTGWKESYPCKKRSECGDLLERFNRTVGVPKTIRSDNAQEFKGANTKWRLVASQRGINVFYSPPYTPQENGVVERYNRTHGDGIRACLVGVDKGLWDWAAKYVTYVHNRINSKPGRKSPFEKRFKRPPPTRYFRRFGCLCYPKVHTHRTKLEDKYERGVFLGYSQENSTFLCGVWRDSAKEGVQRFSVVENRTVKFDEDTLIHNIEVLKTHTPTQISFPDPSTLGDAGVCPDALVLPGGCHEPRRGGPCVATPHSMEPEVEMEVEVAPPEVMEELVVTETSIPTPAQPDGDVEMEDVSPAVEAKPEGDVSMQDATPTVADSPDGAVVDPRVIVGPDGVVRKKRGRKPGTRAQPHWKTPGPKKGPKRRSKRQAALNLISLCQAASFHARSGHMCVSKSDSSTALLAWAVAKQAQGEVNLPNAQSRQVEAPGDCVGSGGQPYHSALEALVRDTVSEAEDEEALSFTVQVSRKEAFEGPDAPKWLEADTLERTQLEAHKCWRPVLDGELTPQDEIIPAVVIYTRKRCGRFKARMVALGNRQTQLGNAEIYSPVISHAGNRYLLVEAAANGHHLTQFDISNAFIQSAFGDEKVFVRLPKHWSSDPKGDRVRLLKSLYGLKVAPRRWFDCYRSYLEGDGWKMDPLEPGLFRKASLSLVIYVDDTLLAGPDKAEVLRAQERVLAHFKGKVVPPVMEDDGETEVRDVIGMTVKYNRRQRKLLMNLEQYIGTLLARFKMTDCSVKVTPCTHGSVSEGPENKTFPIRSLVGGLQYVAVGARPDIVYAVNIVARQVNDCRESTVTAAKRILAYLKGTRTLGLEYSPQLEKDFRSVYGKIAAAEGKSLTDFTAFSDADFAGCTVTLRSTSGSIIYYRGVPIVWSSKRQTVRALSTCESEYVAAYDTIRLVQSQGFMTFLLEENRLPLTFVDSQSALGLAKTTLTNKRSKHIHLRYHVVRDHVKDLCYVPTDVNKADPLTKPLVNSKYLSLFRCSRGAPMGRANSAKAIRRLQDLDFMEDGFEGLTHSYSCFISFK